MDVCESLPEIDFGGMDSVGVLEGRDDDEGGEFWGGEMKPLSPTNDSDFFVAGGQKEEWATEVVTEDAVDMSKGAFGPGGSHGEDGRNLELIKYKRKLRNRESAARSRRKQQIAIESLRKDVTELCKCSKGILDRCRACALENARLKEENTRLFCQNTNLRLQLFMVMCSKAVPQLRKYSALSFKGLPHVESSD